MREVVQPVIKRVFEGEACRVTVQRRADDGLIDVQISAPGVAFAHLPPIFAMSPEQFVTFANEIAAVLTRVQDAALEFKADAMKREAQTREAVGT